MPIDLENLGEIYHFLENCNFLNQLSNKYKARINLYDR